MRPAAQRHARRTISSPDHPNRAWSASLSPGPSGANPARTCTVLMGFAYAAYAGTRLCLRPRGVAGWFTYHYSSGGLCLWGTRTQP